MREKHSYLGEPGLQSSQWGLTKCMMSPPAGRLGSYHATGLCSHFHLRIVPAAAEFFSDASAFALIPHGGVVQGSIEELGEDVHELQLALQFHGAV
jgi:hypothetical protein